MTVVYNLFLVCHLLGMAALVGGYFAVLGAPRISEVMVWGARLQFVTGLILVGLGEAVLDKDYNHVKIGVKLLLSTGGGRARRDRPGQAEEGAGEPEPGPRDRWARHRHRLGGRTLDLISGGYHFFGGASIFIASRCADSGIRSFIDIANSPAFVRTDVPLPNRRLKADPSVG